MQNFIRNNFGSLAAASLAAVALSPAQAAAQDAPWRYNAANEDVAENAIMLRLHRAFGPQRLEDTAPRLSLSMSRYDALDVRTVDFVSFSLASGQVEQRLDSPFIYRVDGEEGGFFSSPTNVIFTVLAAATVVVIAVESDDEDEDEGHSGCTLAQDPGFALSTSTHRRESDQVFTCMM